VAFTSNHDTVFLRKVKAGNFKTAIVEHNLTWSFFKTFFVPNLNATLFTNSSHKAIMGIRFKMMNFLFVVLTGGKFTPKLHIIRIY
jgi:hypothetical protein